MPRKILLIESDQAFAGRISRSLEASGFQVRTAADGKEGLELARDAAPHAIVLCVELAGMSGYLVCQKLKKDDALKAIPLVLTSAEATEETFDKHRTLKARADEYLLKPYAPEALVEKLGGLVGLPEAVPLADAAVGEDDLVTLEAELEIGPGDGEPEPEIVGLDLRSLPDERPPDDDPSPSVDDDLRLLDDAFDGLAAAPAAKAAAAALDELTGDPSVVELEPADDDGAALDALEDADAALGRLGAADGLPALDLGDETPRPAEVDGPDLVGAMDLASEGGDALDALDELDAPRPRSPDTGRDAPPTQPGSERVREAEAEADARAARDDARRAEERARAAEASAAEATRKLAQAEERAAAAEEGARRKAAEAAAAAGAAAKVDALERELDELRTELLVARGEADGARGEIEKRTAELRKRVGELEAANAKNEERVVKAYQKIKADEKIREKVRKALAIATQLLDEGSPPESPAERERRAAALLGRE